LEKVRHAASSSPRCTRPAKYGMKALAMTPPPTRRNTRSGRAKARTKASVSGVAPYQLANTFMRTRPTMREIPMEAIIRAAAPTTL